MRGISIFWISLAFLTGCLDFGEPIHLGPAQPALVLVEGTAKLPKGVSFASNHSVRLYSLDDQAIAAGSILDGNGNYSLSVPPGALKSTPVLFHLALREGNATLYSAPLRLEQRSKTGRQDIDSATTALWLAAHESFQKGSSPLLWNFDRLLQDKSVIDAAAKIEGEAVQWRQDLKAKPLSAEIQGQIDRILAIASKV
ncbi:MAG TPA: hypothetical protein DD435_03005 [Cyanobacteria bacterium UBA8530]|nr:hypothetical protein [Cyanobacteria bacterium UBA8530]